ncbi:MAG: hypothetical protein JWN01_158 [Patescibacteria group bacterium]|nr:hypothetical protein [Patescibacteria group bacterium]
MQLLIVSNRLPISVTKAGGKLSFKPSPGGLATAMSSLGKGWNYSWIGWPGIASDELTAQDKLQITQELQAHNCYPVFLTAKQIANFYEGYSNTTIWPLFHYFQSLTKYRSGFWEEYQKVAKLFRKEVLKHATEKSLIWVHDYQLMTLPRLLRDALPHNLIGFFLHIPFPSYEIYRLLPERKAVLEGLLGADLVGFHTYDYADHFMSSTLRILGRDNKLSGVILKDRIVRADVFPIGIDYRKFANAHKSPAVKKEAAALRNHFGSRRIILSVDRLDYSKGILERLEAFELFLENNPGYHKKIVLVVIAVPSRAEVDAYRQLRENTEQAVSRINGKFGSVDWTPISYQYKNLPFEQLVALYGEADVALITPLRDGMNLVAKEYIATKGRRSGVLIVSEMAGVADELPEATRVNPSDKVGIAGALETALQLPSVEQKRRLHVMQTRLSKYNVVRWAEDFIEQLSDTQTKKTARDIDTLTPQIQEQLIADFRKAKRRLLLFDYDGTLTNFVSNPRPASAKPSPALLGMLTKLSGAPGTKLAIVSGRPKTALEGWFGKLPFSLVAEHGGWTKVDGAWTPAGTAAQDWKAGLRLVLEQATERTPGALIEEKDYSLVWHYRNVTPHLAYVRKASLLHDTQKQLKNSEIETFEGSKTLEFKPRAINKKTAAAKLIGKTKYDFILSIGDDNTDEDMFAALPESAYTIRVGRGASQARYHLASVEQVLMLVSELSAVLP